MKHSEMANKRAGILDYGSRRLQPPKKAKTFGKCENINVMLPNGE